MRLSNEKLDYLAQRVESYDHGYPCLGYGLVDIYSKGTYSKDCVHNFDWYTKELSFAIDFIKADTCCDIKVPWEKSRLQWLTEIAILVAHDRLPIEDVYTRLTNWSNENPFLYGVNWISSMEVAIRVMNLVVILLLLEKEQHKQLNDLLLKLIASHKAYLELYPEISDVPGNHYLATEAGVAAIMYAAGESYEPQRLLALFEQQFPDGGMHLEFSTIYNRLCVDIALIACALLPDVTSNKPLSDKLLSMIDSVNMLSSSKALLPIFGDSDSGQVFNFGQSSREATLYTSNVPSSKAISILSELVRSLNPDVWQLVESHQTKSETSFSLYPYYVMENNTYKVIVRYGGAGLAGRAPHDHDDVMSFWTFKNGADLIVERGCAPYTSDFNYREQLISYDSHNQLRRKTEKARLTHGSVFPIAPVGESEITANGLKVELKNGVHRRKLMLTDNGLLITDIWFSDEKCASVFYPVDSAEFDIKFQKGLLSDSCKKDKFFTEYGALYTEIKRLYFELDSKGEYQIEFS
ncbi:heparinase II/III-like protein [Pleionea mediterranea]|uniref:Heparinase II/III-like protein n=2 Tax=Pleionea mediterranea TaxID=523701 RepID=A0A316FRV5_9GAMM|nr:heparinase II/III-like protein [Pleionea mediterranea]